MAEKKEDLSLVSYTLGIVSIIMSFISSYGLGGIIFGICSLLPFSSLVSKLTFEVRGINFHKS